MRKEVKVRCRVIRLGRLWRELDRQAGNEVRQVCSSRVRLSKRADRSTYGLGRTSVWQEAIRGLICKTCTNGGRAQNPTRRLGADKKPLVRTREGVVTGAPLGTLGGHQCHSGQWAVGCRLGLWALQWLGGCQASTARARSKFQT